jgi:glyceraldehyde 3-phosphate dehydrogenase
MRIAINGMGRIGRLLFRMLSGQTEHQLIAVNDIMDTDNLAYLLKYDSLYGTSSENILVEGKYLLSGTRKVVALNEPNAEELPWKELDIDVVIECSGRYTSKQGATSHLRAGAKKVLLSTTGSPDIPLMIYGFNHHQLTKETDIVSPGGCMTNCTTHVLNIINSIGIESAQINILHSYTSRQQLVDTWHKQFRRGRAAAESIIPVEIDLHVSLERLLTPLKNKVMAMSTRVPVTNGAMADFSIQLKEPATANEINTLFKKAAEKEYKGILDYTEDPLVSADIKGNTHSCIIDGTLTTVIGKQVKLIAWFDNEYGFTSRMLDWLNYWKKTIQ